MKKYKWEIDKKFNWEMGHRVWSQRLEDARLSVSTDCCCKHLHGHSYSLKVFLGSDHLDQSSMVTDFKNLNFVKEFLDKVLDHKFMIDVNDPNFKKITGLFWIPKLESNFTNLEDYVYDEDPMGNEHLTSFVLVNFCPTSENICKYLFEYIQDYLGDFATVTAVELWETEKSHCRYEG